MNALLVCAQFALLIFQFLLAMLEGYLLLLTVAAFKAGKQTTLPPGSPTSRFLILVPAHNEERLIPNLLDNLAELDYPAALFEIHVVADNCTDHTAAVALAHKAIVHERKDDRERGKGYALQWLLDEITRCDIQHDALVILDADSLVSGNFLRVMDARLARGERVIQAYYAVRDPGRSWNGSLRYAALAVLHYLRPQGRMVLGGSAGLKGNGMAFSAALMKARRWSGSITEDIDQHMSLLLDGGRVIFAPDAIVWGEMPDTLASSESQVARWESGRLQMARRYLLPLIKSAWRELQKGDLRRSYLLLDAVMEHIIPPFSILMGLSLACLGIDLVFFLSTPITQMFPLVWFHSLAGTTHIAWMNVYLGIGLLLGQVIYLLAGLKMVGAPGFIYRRLCFIPAYIVWKIWSYFRIVLGRVPQGWVRTARNGG